MQDQDISGIVIQIVVVALALAALLLFAWDDRKSRRERAAEDRAKTKGEGGSNAQVDSEKTP